MSLVEKLYDYNLRAGDIVEPPVLGTPAIHGTPGTASHSYVATIVTLVGETTPTNVSSTSTAPNTLSGVNYVRLSVDSAPAAAIAIRWYKLDGAVYKLLGETEPTVLFCDDTGQTLQADVLAPSENTSGRPEWRALLFNHGRYLQRQELIDLQWILLRTVKELGDTIHTNGDVISGCAEQFVSGTTWNFTAGQIYLDGQHVGVPAGQVVLTGTGKEVVGLRIVPTITTDSDDPVIRNQDEEVDLTYAQAGADRLVYTITWVIDEDGQLPIKEFLDGAPKVATVPVERTELDRALALRTRDVSGSFVVENFPLDVVEHATDDTKLVLRVGPGVAYPNGFRVQTKSTQSIEFGKARDVKAENNSGVEPFVIPGGAAVTTNVENFNVDGLKVKLSFGSGNQHEVTLSGSGKTATEVGTQIAAAINAYPTDGTLFTYVVAAGKLQLKAPEGKSLTIHAVTDDAYTILGLTPGTYAPTGTRIYEINDEFVKDVSDLNYKTELIEAVTHNGTTHVDALGHTGVVEIIGASTLVADCHDGKWDYQLGVDFIKDGNSISFAGLGGAEPSNGATFYVKYRYNRNATKGSRVLVRVVDAQIVKGAEDGADDIVVTGASSITSVATGLPVAGLSGTVSDVVRILRVNAASGQSQTQFSSHSLSKNSTGLAHNVSQINWAAAGEQGEMPDGQPTTGATYYCTFEFWHHAVEGDFVSADSYDVYEDIESYAGLNLRDCIDFRTTSGILPTPGEDTALDYNYYLSRIDKLILDDNGTFRLVTGSPALSPPVPNDQESTLSVAILRIRPYTYSTSEVGRVSLEVMRITQSGLSDLRKRLERLEYFNVVNDHEKELSGSPAAANSQGIMADALTGFGRMDLSFNRGGVSHTAALDRASRCLLLPASQSISELEVDLAGSTNVTKIGNTLMLSYTPEVIQEQPFATLSINAASDFTYEDYLGVMTLSPAVDVYVDSEQMPQLNVDFDNNVQSLIDVANATLANQINWGSWNITNSWWNWAGWNEFGNNVFWESVAGTRQGTRQVLVPGSIQRDLGDRVVDLSLVGKMRTKLGDGSPFVVTISASGLMPNQDHAVSIAGIPCDFTYDSDPDTPFGQQGVNSYLGCTTVRSNNSGRLTGKFVMPSGVNAGTALVKVFHYNNPTHSLAQAVFSSAGLMETKQSTSIGMNSPMVQTETITQSSVWASGRWTDPIAQSFVVRDELTYISGVGVYFRSKHADLPITLVVREMVNGYPGQRVLATATLDPADITVSDDASAESVFWFEHVLGYNPDTEFCFVLIPGKSNTGYELWASELGGIDVSTGLLVNTQPHDGVLFHSPNNRTWEPWTKRDLKFKLYKSNFENSAQIVFSEITGLQASTIVTAIQQFAGPGTAVRWSYSLNGVSWIPFRPDIDVVLGEIISNVSLRVDVTSLGGSYQMIDRVAGVLFLLHLESADAVWNNEFFTDDLNYPNKITAIFALDTDGTGGTGTRTVTPYYSVDDGVTWVEIKADPTYIPVAAEDPYWTYQFATPGQASVTDASNATPIVISSTNHGFTENSIVDIATVGGNTAANGTWRAVNVTDDTFELVDPDTGADSTGNGAYTTGGTITLSEFSQMRPRVQLFTTNRARTPRVGSVGFICSRES